MITTVILQNNSKVVIDESPSNKIYWMALPTLPDCHRLRLRWGYDGFKFYVLYEGFWYHSRETNEPLRSIGSRRMIANNWRVTPERVKLWGRLIKEYEKNHG